MNKETRIQNIQAIIDRDRETPFGRQEIPWEDSLTSMNVYKIPLTYLIYNKYNGRILSRTKSIENQRQNIDVETDEGKALIEKLLWDSKIDRNKKTFDSIFKNGQEKVGIITKDGIIIDGNRRAMLLGKTQKFDYFKTVVLDVTLEENPLEIEKLETSYQMGEDEKLGYNPIEKYLKADSLYLKLCGGKYKRDEEADSKSIKKISDWMGENKSIVLEYLDVMQTMDEYLEYLEYDGIYTQLDAREDPFIYLTRWLRTFDGEESGKAFDGYRNEDVDDLKLICFDYIRIQYEGKKFRNIAHGLKVNHFFGDKNIWRSFSDFHFEKRGKIVEEKINFNSENLEAHLDDRDNKFLEATYNSDRESFMDENVNTHIQAIEYKRSAEQPTKLITNAKRAVESINKRHRSFSQPLIQKQLGELNSSISEMLNEKSPEIVLDQTIKQLKGIKKIDENINKEDLFNKAKEIQRICYELCKKIKKA